MGTISGLGYGDLVDGLLEVTSGKPTGGLATVDALDYARALAGRDVTTLSKRLATGVLAMPQDEANWLADLVRALIEFDTARDALRLPDIVSEAMDFGGSFHETLRSVDYVAPTWAPSMIFPTGVRTLDSFLGGGESIGRGGFRGCVALVGKPKLGKSIFALRCGLEALRAGWTVLYVNAELTAREINERIANAILHDHAPDELVAALERFYHFHAWPGVCVAHIAQRMSEVLSSPGRDGELIERILVIPDSVNTIAELAGLKGSKDYFGILSGLMALASITRRESSGLISWLLVSETNRQGGAKGGKLEYSCDQVVKLKATKGSPGLVDFAVAFNRSGADGHVGSFRNDYKAMRFSDGLEAQRPLELPAPPVDDQGDFGL